MLHAISAAVFLLFAPANGLASDAHRHEGSAGEERVMADSGDAGAAGEGRGGGEGREGDAGARMTAPLRVMSFNIRTSAALDLFNRWSSRRRGVAAVLEGEPRPGEAAGWDIVGLQEARRGQLDELHRLVPGYGEVAYGRDDGRSGGEHAAILYNDRRLSLVDSGVFWFSETPEVPGSRGWGASYTRQCVWARLVDRDSGQGICVYNVHLDHRSARARRESARLLAERIASRAHRDPVLVLGDFNAGESSEPVRYLLGEGSARGAGLVDTYRTVHPGSAPAGTFNRFKGRADGQKIDYVLASEGAVVVDAGIDRRRFDGRLPSDHFPVTASVALPVGRDLASAGDEGP